MLRAFFLFLILSGISVVAIAGFRGSKFKAPPIEIFADMDRQAKYKPQKTSEFFADGRVERRQVTGTVPFGYNAPIAKSDGQVEVDDYYQGFTHGDSYLDTGKFGDNWGTGIPVAVTTALLERGQQRYAINCTVCHSDTGAGNGIVTQYGLVGVPTFHQDRLRVIADGEIYNTIVHGKNTMMSYGDKITREDRWAIVAYVRALQRAQNAGKTDVPPEALAKLEAK